MAEELNAIRTMLEMCIRDRYSTKTAKQVGRDNLTKPYLKSAIEVRLKQLESDRIADATEMCIRDSIKPRGPQKN